MIVTLAWPPPSHMVTRPRRPPVRSNVWSSVVSRRAPVAPSGWPSAIAPPHAFTRARSAPVSRCQARTTEANASLISTRSMSSRVSPARALVRGYVAVGRDLGLEGAVVDGPGGALVAGQRVALHLGAADPPLGGDQVGRAELGDLLGAVPGPPAFRAGERVTGHRRSD